MGKLLIVSRLVARDLRYRRGETAMLLVAFVAATATLTLGLILHGVTSRLYQQTRAATAGPDVEATAFPSGGGSPADCAALASLVWWLVAVALLTVAGVAGLTAASAWAGARNSIAAVLQAEVA
jgi:hypothetical protein